jgi:hypothetical protein
MLPGLHGRERRPIRAQDDRELVSLLDIRRAIDLQKSMIGRYQQARKFIDESPTVLPQLKSELQIAEQNERSARFALAEAERIARAALAEAEAKAAAAHRNYAEYLEEFAAWKQIADDQAHQDAADVYAEIRKDML